MSDGIEVALIEGIVALLAGLPATGPGARRNKYTWKPEGTYAAADGFGLYVDLDPQDDLPTITIADYPVSEDVVGGDAVIGIQFRIESKDRRAVKNAVSDLRDHLHGRWGGNLGSVTLIQATRSSGTTLGQDTAGRLARTENYYLTIYRP